MITNYISWLEKHGAVVSQNKKRVEFPLNNGGRIVCYYPIEGVQVFAYDIRSAQPDLTEFFSHTAHEGSFIRTNACRDGSCEISKNGKSTLLWANEVAVDYCAGYTPLEHNTMQCQGFETIFYFDVVKGKGSVYQMLYEKASEVSLQRLATGDDRLFCFKMSATTKRELDNIIQDCFNGADASFILLKAAELGCRYCEDKKNMKIVRRILVSKSQMTIAEDIYRSLTDHYDQKWTAQSFADKYGFSTTTVKKYFESVYGYEFKAYQIKVRMDRAAEMLRTTTLPVGEIAQRTGYSTHAKFGAMFKEKFGVTPLEYRRTCIIQNTKKH